MSCSGRGDCFKQDDDGNYKQDFKDHCDRDCALMKCPNFKFCNQELPEWLLGCHGGRCYHCNITFYRNLEFRGISECPVCLEEKETIKRINCEHSTCIDCFRESFRTSFYPQPEYPYPDEDDHPENDPAVQRYNALYDLWEMMESQEYERRAYLRSCPICRATEEYDWSRHNSRESGDDNTVIKQWIKG